MPPIKEGASRAFDRKGVSSSIPSCMQQGVLQLGDWSVSQVHAACKTQRSHLLHFYQYQSAGQGCGQKTQDPQSLEHMTDPCRRPAAGAGVGGNMPRQVFMVNTRGNACKSQTVEELMMQGGERASSGRALGVVVARGSARLLEILLVLLCASMWLCGVAVGWLVVYAKRSSLKRRSSSFVI